MPEMARVQSPLCDAVSTVGYAPLIPHRRKGADGSGVGPLPGSGDQDQTGKG